MTFVKGLVITEKSGPCESQRDGGARLIDTLKEAFGNSLNVMQFGADSDPSCTWHYNYPFQNDNRFERRLANGNFIAEKIKNVESHFTHILFIHISMQFGLIDNPLREGLEIWTFPMFLTPSYKASGENVPKNYTERERQVLACSKNIITPSPLEKKQIIHFYSVPFEHIHIIPRGVDIHILSPQIRSFKETLHFCSIGSIKPQKNILGLIQLFSKIYLRYPGATLQIIGPIQNSAYYERICKEIQKLDLKKSIHFSGFVLPSELSKVVKKAHFHLSTSTCETFGRAIFETLALGIPNIARFRGNAATDFLKNLPYVQFVDDDEKALESIEKMLFNFPKLSKMSQEIGVLFSDQFLLRLLKAKISHHDCIGISDFDGTLYHKEDQEKTFQSIEAFRKFSVRIICSARPISQLIKFLKNHHLEVDWVIGYSGGVVSDGKGNLLWMKPLKKEQIHFLEKTIPQTSRISFMGEVLQIAVSTDLLPDPLFGFRIEFYQEMAFISCWEASKLRTTIQLLQHIEWPGQVRVFGDGPYDEELLTYFDGISDRSNFIQKEESMYV